MLHVSTPRTADTDLAAWAAAALAGSGLAGDGLYVATTTAGGFESVAFWRGARDAGLAFANPRLFPWTLANSPTGAIARALDIRGPTYTLVGTDDAVDAIVTHAEDDLEAGVVTRAVLVAVDAHHDRYELAAWSTTSLAPSPGRSATPHDTAVEALVAARRA